MGIDKIEVTGFKLPVGVGKRLQLTEKQASVRAGSLKELGGGMYEVTRIIEFKIGEIIGVEVPDIPKSDLKAVSRPGQETTLAEEIRAEKEKAARKPGRPKKQQQEPESPPVAETAPKDEPVTPDGKTIVDPTA